MEPALLRILIGLIVGSLIGLTGLGGGVLLLPILIFGLGVPAIKAVGSDALFNFITKIPSSVVHLSKGTVRRKVVIALAVGSVPGSILGVRLLQHLRIVYGAGVNDFIKSAVGILLIVVSTLLLLQRRIEAGMANRPPTAKSFAGMAAIGLVAGFLVGMTSVGSGSMIMMLLLLFSLVGYLLVGSIPGGLIGSYLSTRVPVLWLRRILCAILLTTGVRMLIAPPIH